MKIIEKGGYFDSTEYPIFGSLSEEEGKNVDFIVSRHPATIKFLREKFPQATVLEHVEAKTIKNKNVAGTLPLHLASVCRWFISLSLDLPREVRGQEITDITKYNPSFEIYHITSQRIGCTIGGE